MLDYKERRGRLGDERSMSTQQPSLMRGVLWHPEGTTLFRQVGTLSRIAQVWSGSARPSLSVAASGTYGDPTAWPSFPNMVPTIPVQYDGSVCAPLIAVCKLSARSCRKPDFSGV